MRGFALLCWGWVLVGCWASFPDSRFRQDGSGSRGDGPAHVDQGAHDGNVLPHDFPLAGDGPAQVRDGSICQAGEFVECSHGRLLVKCNAAATGTVQVDCFPAACDTELKRCDGCDPAIARTCVDTNLVTCSPDGVPSTTPCPDGCADGECTGCTKQTFYQDADGDHYGNPNVTQESCLAPTGYVADNTDCNDQNIAVHPNQVTPRVTPYSTPDGPSFDYNCDGQETPTFPNVWTSCSMDGTTCTGSGWQTTVPSCGAPTAFFIQCGKRDCQAQSPTRITQTCL